MKIKKFFLYFTIILSFLSFGSLSQAGDYPDRPISVVVAYNPGGDRDGTGGGKVADEVVKEIKDLGGESTANYDSVATVEGGSNIYQTCIDG